MAIGLFNGGREPEWENVTKRAALDLEAVMQPDRYDGSVSGRVGTWYRESDYFNLKDLVFGATIKCFYDKEKYRLIYELFEDKDAVVHVTGSIRADRATGQPIEIRVVHVEEHRPLSDHEFLALLGSVPLITGEEATDSYLDRIRGNGET